MKRSSYFRLAVLLIVLSLGFQLLLAPAALAQGQSGTTLSASVTANSSATRTFHWTIDKSVSPETWNLFTGDSGTSHYTITVTKDGGTLAAAVDGQVCVTNGGAIATENLTIVAKFVQPGGPGGTVLTSAPVDLSGNPVLDPGESACYSYHIDITSFYVEGAARKVTADVTITNHSGHLDTPFGPSPSADVVLASPTLVNDSINVDDSNGGSWPFNASGSTTYDRTFTCNNDSGAHGNTATIRETGQSDSASVTVNCYALNVSKTATTSFTRTYSWSIAKSSATSNLTLATGESYPVSYAVTVSNTGYTDSEFSVYGSISVSNPAPIAATINSVSDVVAPNIAANVDCGVGFPYSLGSGGSLNCTYSAGPYSPNPFGSSNTATVSLQNYAYNGGVTPTGTTGFTGSAGVSFGAPSSEVDRCVSVTDSLYGILGSVCVNEAPHTFNYSLTVGPYAECGPRDFTNTASFTASDTGATGGSSWTVHVDVPCGGCTLTQGYWKTHSLAGPAPYDDTWAQVGGSNAIFLHGLSYYTILWTPPSGGNVWYQLAHQYIAAYLNGLNGASTAVVSTQMTQAYSLLSSYTPTASIPNATRNQFRNLATALDNFNNGLTGPGHCSE